MFHAIFILAVSTGLFFFYIQTFCERALRREFDRQYFNDIISAIELEYPRLREALIADSPLSYPQVNLALKCDFTTLVYLLKNSDPKRQRFSREERAIVLYFRFLLFCLPFRYAMKLRSRDAALQLTTILQYFANLIGEKVGASYPASMAADHLS